MRSGRPATTCLSAQGLRAACTKLREEGRELRRIPVLEICSGIGKAATSWLAPDSAGRRQALAELPGVTGFPVKAIEIALDNLFGELAEERLVAVLRSELGNPELVDNAGGTTTACGPRLTVHVLAGNVPGVGIPGMVAALMLKSPCLVKVSSREPLLATLFAQSLAAMDSPVANVLARNLVVTSWKGGDTEREAAVLEQAELVVAYGDLDTISSLRNRVPGRMITYGPRISAGLVLNEASENIAEVAREAALQAALFDQRGCLSPQFFLVESGCDPTMFMRHLAAELEQLSTTLPRTRLSLDEAGGLRRFVEFYRWKRAMSSTFEIALGEKSLDWVVAKGETEEMPPPMPGNRAVAVIPVSELGGAVDKLHSLRGQVEALGVAGPIDRLRPFAIELASLGVSRVCPLDRLQRPPFSWRQGGLPRLASLARWLGLESS